ncbi:MAG: FecR domain-containing protein [Bdellovibrionales bacterium]|nr:FecR domain-containing protein [Bdellovibrionales bacterium]
MAITSLARSLGWLTSFGLAFGAVVTARAGSEAPAGTIKLIKGEVMVQDATAKIVGDTSGKRSRTLQTGAPFYVGETIITKADGRVKIEFVEGKNEIVLGTNTSLLIERASTDPLKSTGTSLSLARGEVRSTVNQKYSGKGTDVYEVKTPNAVAGVRGTIFLARFNPKTFHSEVATERGLVAVRNVGAGAGVGGAPREVFVKPGEFTSAAGSKAVTPPAPISSNKDLESAVKSMAGSGESDSGKKNLGVEGGDTKGEANKGDEAKTGDKPADGAAPAKQEGGQKDAPLAANGKDSKGGDVAAAGGNKDSGGDVPLGREPASASTNGRAPASVSPGAGPGGPGMDSMVGGSGMKTAANVPPPILDIATQNLNRVTNTAQTINQQVNQQTQVGNKARFKVKL